MIENFDYADVLDGVKSSFDVKLSSEYIEEIQARTLRNKDISEYYVQRFEETGKDKYFRHSVAVEGCGQALLFDFHHKTEIADLIRIQLCHDRFCFNCGKMKQVTALQRFMPPILSLSDDYDICHLVLTAPNVGGEYLRTYMGVFYEAYPRLIRFLRGTDTIHGVDLRPLDLQAALRNTEITYKGKGYHLHIHSIIAFAKGLDLPKIYINNFSYNRVYDKVTKKWKRVLVRKFSALEIFLQKLWRLLVDQITARVYKFGSTCLESLPKSSPLYHVFADNAALKFSSGKKKGKVTLDSIRAMGINDGYSVILDPVANDHFVQVFKYAFKVTDEDDAFMSYMNFCDLEHAVAGKKLMQGYGKWRNLKCDEEIDEGFDEFFEVFKAYLWQVDYPESVNLTPDEALLQMKEGRYTFITRSKISRLLQDPSAQKLLLHKDEFPAVPKRLPQFPDLGLSYERYLRKKEQKHVFGTLRTAFDPDSGKRMLLLTEQQLNFLQDIF